MAKKIIDAHGHIFPNKIAQAATKNIGKFYSLPMAHGGTAEELLELGQKYKVEKTIVCSVATRVEQVPIINKFIQNKIEKEAAFEGLICLHPNLSSKELDSQIDFALANGFKGVKLHPDFQEFYIDSPKAENIYSAVEGILPILFHIGDPNKDFASPKRLVKILKRYPHLRAVAAHLGGYTKWDEVAVYGEVDNCYYDTSSALCFMDKQRGRELIAYLGEDRVMLGSDYPMSDIGREVELLLSLGLDKDKKEAILYTNAVKFYNL